MSRDGPVHTLRRVEPELLDALAPDDPRALRARRDLWRVNMVMLQPGIMRGLMARHAATPPRRLIDLGAGDGRFMLDVARGIAPRWSGVSITFVDRNAALGEDTRAAFQALGWRAETVAADAGSFLAALSAGSADVITANLFLHHLPTVELQHLFAQAARVAPLFVACEPHRGRAALLGSRLLWALGCGAVTRYDAPVSVRAGFRASELSQLWPDSAWILHEGKARLFTHVFVARRRS